MNKLLIISLLILVCSCRKQETINSSGLVYETLKPERFNIQEYEINSKEGEAYIQEFRDSDTIRIEKGWNTSGNNYYKTCTFRKDGIEIYSYCTYYPSGEIKEKCTFWNDFFTFPVEKEYHFNATGDIINIIDHEKPFRIGVKEIKEILEERNIRNYHLDRFIFDYPYWSIMYYDTTYFDSVHYGVQRFFINIDGIYGDILRDTKYMH